MSNFDDTATAPWKLVVTLLKDVTVTLQTADGRRCPVSISPNATRLQLLAYLGWLRNGL